MQPCSSTDRFYIRALISEKHNSIIPIYRIHSYKNQYTTKRVKRMTGQPIHAQPNSVNFVLVLLDLQHTKKIPNMAQPYNLDFIVRQSHHVIRDFSNAKRVIESVYKTGEHLTEPVILALVPLDYVKTEPTTDDAKTVDTVHHNKHIQLGGESCANIQQDILSFSAPLPIADTVQTTKNDMRRRGTKRHLGDVYPDDNELATPDIPTHVDKKARLVARSHADSTPPIRQQHEKQQQSELQEESRSQPLPSTPSTPSTPPPPVPASMAEPMEECKEHVEYEGALISTTTSHTATYPSMYQTISSTALDNTSPTIQQHNDPQTLPSTSNHVLGNQRALALLQQMQANWWHKELPTFETL